MSKTTSEYLKLIKSGNKRSRARNLTPEQVKDRNAEQARRNRMRQEARRRALMVLQHQEPSSFVNRWNGWQKIQNGLQCKREVKHVKSCRICSSWWNCRDCDRSKEKTTNTRGLHGLTGC